MSQFTASDRMRLIKREHTQPELVVRRLLHRMGLRFRLHSKFLPGSPDVVLPKRRTVVFVHGCYWHRHPGCRYASTPKIRQDFWLPKFASNVERDNRKAEQLRDLGWRVVVVWECETKDLMSLDARLRKVFLVAPAPQGDAGCSGQ
ncbi:very short patch repair endonuclease [Pseudomonas sp. B21-035]|uniref:very short patch repair endonuclease n=1 Tax=Pseudomonas sp. B21-035 TaxID=2895484 RepID=UPI002160C82C|nr:DNA mismatch endonuclease Vsr [Pseudomonas sp. B21-035]UVL54530.1 DNA mismatch endonuclease Vsr [Pseudomonas sp. B21-035]